MSASATPSPSPSVRPPATPSADADRAGHVATRPVRFHGAAVGQITVDWDADSNDGTVRLTLSVAPGPLPRTAREALVEAAFVELPARAEHVLATLPLGDVDLLDALRRRVRQPRVRAAGGTCLLDGQLAR